MNTTSCDDEGSNFVCDGSSPTFPKRAHPAKYANNVIQMERAFPAKSCSDDESYGALAKWACLAKSCSVNESYGALTKRACPAKSCLNDENCLNDESLRDTAKRACPAKSCSNDKSLRDTAKRACPAKSCSKDQSDDDLSKRACPAKYYSLDGTAKKKITSTPIDKKAQDLIIVSTPNSDWTEERISDVG